MLQQHVDVCAQAGTANVGPAERDRESRSITEVFDERL
jgi:hypothetical protein